MLVYLVYVIDCLYMCRVSGCDGEMFPCFLVCTLLCDLFVRCFKFNITFLTTDVSMMKP